MHGIAEMPQTMGIKKPQEAVAINLKEKDNWLLHQMFIRHEYDSCLKKIDEILGDPNDKSEYALFIKAMILRIKGNIHESLELFKKCHLLAPNNSDYLKQFGRSLYLLGRHKAAIDVYDECLKLNVNDWEVFYYKGLSYKYLRIYDEAVINF
jgi:Bardet-Biedl syndrome 4 protein